MRKTNATALPTYRSLMVSELGRSSETPIDLYPSLCLNVENGHQHISMLNEIKLKGIIRGRTAYASVNTYDPGAVGNHCRNNAMMITTDLSNLDNMENDLYTGSLNITVSNE